MPCRHCCSSSRPRGSVRDCQKPVGLAFVGALVDQVAYALQLREYVVLADANDKRL
ncbi:hypothetical protein DPMN_024810 [Dreissena polymorpha]|uniref:Uncharacterized protein n=1 Tax=Dreissena polymorpha TaxID=45954 RepID=A0A9D4LN54_DREPO|nr:hypothetical protein DPMN_024556 [Dreissena polymorpha]KAH3861858.1 hypothetical protein DPMN_024810 [Dreissena polymorpha]